MNCLESRRALLAEPRRHGPDLRAHLAQCGECSRVSARIEELDRDIAEAAWVPAPDALPERVLLGRRHRPRWQYAAAAAVALAAGLGALFSMQIVDAPFVTPEVAAVGPAHPAVIAISEVAEDTPRAPVSESDAARELERVFKRLGLSVKEGEATTRYVGKCHVTAGGCDHIVLSTPDAQANVMLVPDYPLGGRVVVADRNLVAVVEPEKTGGYIVVADSPKTARRIQKLLVKG